MEFIKIKTEKVSTKIANKIREAILSGKFKIGESLPSERKLSEKFGVHRSSLREALKELSNWGLIKISHGEKTTVKNFLLDSGVQILPYLICPGGKINTKIIKDILEIRVFLLGVTAFLAAKNSEQNLIDKLKDCLVDLKKAKDPLKLQELDFEFFYILVEMTQNTALKLLVNSIKEIYLKNKELFVNLYNDLNFKTEFHEKVIESILVKDKLKAKEAFESYGKLALEVFKDVN